jgi:PAS domain-containing protein
MDQTNLYDEILRSISVACLIFDKKTGFFLSASEAALQLYSYARDEILTKTLADLTPASITPAPVPIGLVHPEDVVLHVTKLKTTISVHIRWHDIIYHNLLATFAIVLPLRANRAVGAR